MKYTLQEIKKILFRYFACCALLRTSLMQTCLPGYKLIPALHIRRLLGSTEKVKQLNITLSLLGCKR